MDYLFKMSYPRVLENYLPLTGGNLTGQLKTSSTEGYMANNTSHTNYGYTYGTMEGALLSFRSKDYASNPGGFEIFARNETNTYTLAGRADNKSLIWAGQHVLYNTYKITGNITFPTDVIDTFIGIKDTSYIRGTTPTAQRLKSFRVYDGDNYILGDIRFGVGTDGGVFTQIVARNYSSDKTAQYNSALTLKSTNTGSYSLDFNGQHVVRVVATYKNGLSWYRKYSDGWIEQGGRNTPSDYAGSLVTLPIAFKDANYTAVAQSADKTNKRRCQIYQNSATQIWIRTMCTGDAQSKTAVNWYCCGY